MVADAAALLMNPYHDLEAAAEEAIQYLLHIPAQAEECEELLEVIHLQGPTYNHLICSNDREFAGTISSTSSSPSSMISLPHHEEALESIYNSLEDLLVLDEGLINNTVTIKLQGELIMQPALVNGSPPAPASNVQVTGRQQAHHEAMMVDLAAATTHDMNSSWATIPQLAAADEYDDDDDHQLIYNEYSLWDEPIELLNM